MCIWPILSKFEILTVCNEEVIKDNLYQETDNFEGEEEELCEDLTEMETARPMDVKVQGGAGGIAER